MSDVVIDASAALAWTLRSQRTDAAMAFLETRDEASFIAPFIFYWEAQNVLLRLLRSDRLTEIDYVEASAGLKDFDIKLEQPYPAEQSAPLALSQRLSLFDAAYLSLAITKAAPMASRDKDLLAAAQRLGVQTWDLR